MLALLLTVWACMPSVGQTFKLEQGDIYTIQPRAWRQMMQTAEQQAIAPVTKCVLEELARPATVEQGNTTTEASISQHLRDALAEGVKVGLDLPILLVMDQASYSQSGAPAPPSSSRKDGPKATPSGSGSEYYGRESALPLRIMASVAAITASAIWSMSQGSASGLKVCCLLVCLLYLQQRQVVGW